MLKTKVNVALVLYIQKEDERDGLWINGGKTESEYKNQTKKKGLKKVYTLTGC